MCPRCRRVIYYDPKVAAISVVERGEEILLIRRGNQPGYGLWSMPGGYVDRGEVVERAAIREVMEETGLEVEIEQLIGLFSEPGRPVMVAAFAMREIGGLLGPGEEALDVGFFPRPPAARNGVSRRSAHFRPLAVPPELTLKPVH
jgi:ADP-ribose pyrophosphatase YjhB (NUDIX family)